MIELNIYGVIQEMEMWFEIKDNGKREIKGLKLEYQRWFESNVEGHIKILEVELQLGSVGHRENLSR